MTFARAGNTPKVVADECAKRHRKPSTAAQAQCGQVKKRRGTLCSTCFARKAKRKLKAEILAAYGGRCACCGEHREEFLTIDHINNDGAAHRKALGRGVGMGAGIYSDIRRQGFPKDKYQLLCWNCNCAKQHYKICPHESERRQFLADKSISTGDK